MLHFLLKTSLKTQVNYLNSSSLKSKSEGQSFFGFRSNFQKSVLKKYFTYCFLLFLSVLVFYQFNQFLVRKGKLIDLGTYDDLLLASNKDLWIFIFFMVVLFPLLEELSFRLVLVKKPKSIYYGMCFFVGFIPYVMNSKFQWFDLGLLYETGLLLLFVLLMIISFKRYMLKLFEVFNKLSSIQLLVLTSLFFALIHFGNLYTSEMLLFSLVPLLKHFVSGLIYGTFRIKYGFIHGFLLHSINNLVGCLGVISSYYSS
ncbi:CPBP family glutamic-type intramembrane protease [Echinicola sediminis]